MLHPRLAAMVAKAARHPPMHEVPLAIVREAAPKLLATALPPEEIAGVEDHIVHAGGRSVLLRVYRPDPGAVRPLVMFFHGSGFTICSVETHDTMCRQICRRSGSVVVSVDYALAPEHPYPAGPDDCWNATLHVARNAGNFGADPARLALCGDSAGATMAAVVALRARERGGPAIRAQVLIYPVVDHFSAGYASYAERGRGVGLRDDEMRWFWTQYLPDASMASLPDVSPARASTLSGLPQAYVATAEYDVLRDEGMAYAAALVRAGVPVVHRHYDDMNHGFLNWVGVVDRADEAMDALCDWLRLVLVPLQTELAP
jgi:acetyl esterase